MAYTLLGGSYVFFRSPIYLPRRVGAGAALFRLMGAISKLLVVTDLDASLLDESYRWSAARPALARLRAAGFPLVLNSSKTVDEMTDLADEMGMSSPLVAENGGLIALPDTSGRYRTELNGLSRTFILEKAHALREGADFRFIGFADWSSETVAERTGLSLDAAKRAQSRQATEPIIWQDTDTRLVEFQKALAASGIRVVRGGRFHHLMGMVDKADGTAAVLQQYQVAEPETEWTVLALGDSENDRAMLEAADVAVVIPHPEGVRIEPRGPKVVVAPQPSTRGWNAALMTILDEF